MSHFNETKNVQVIYCTRARAEMEGELKTCSIKSAANNFPVETENGDWALVVLLTKYEI
jgi:hypothetical protein